MRSARIQLCRHDRCHVRHGPRKGDQIADRVPLGVTEGLKPPQMAVAGAGDAEARINQLAGRHNRFVAA